MPAGKSRPPERVLVLGLGDDNLTDNAVGLHIAQCAIERLDQHRIEGIDVVAACGAGPELIDIIKGHMDLILVNAVQTGRQAPGAVHEFDERRLGSLRGLSSHFLAVQELLTLGRTFGLPMPGRVRILAVEVQDPFTVGTQLTRAVQRAMPGVVDRVLNLALHWSLDRAGGRAPSRTPAHGHATEP